MNGETDHNNQPYLSDKLTVPEAIRLMKVMSRKRDLELEITSLFESLVRDRIPLEGVNLSENLIHDLLETLGEN